MQEHYAIGITILMTMVSSTRNEVEANNCSYYCLDCHNVRQYKIEIPQDVNVNVDRLLVSSCILQMEEFENILQKFPILNRLYIEKCEPENNSLSHKDGIKFKGITSLETFSINSAPKIFEKHLFNHFPHLLYLYLRNNEIKEIGNIFKNNSNVIVLDLSQNSIENLGSGVLKEFSHLLKLNLRKNQIEFISKYSFEGLNNLKYLELNFNFIRFLDKNTFSELNELISLNLGSNKISTINVNIFRHNHKLQYITLNGNPNLIITDYVFANMSHLRNVSMSDCNLVNIPENIFENCMNLTYLELQNNNLENLPQTVFRSLRNLYFLNLSKNKMLYLPDRVFSNLKNLAYLHLERNQLSSINNYTFRDLEKLKNLMLNENKISNINILSFLQQMNLQKLDLSFNQLTKSDFYLISRYFGLKQLLLSHNNLTDLPENFLSGKYLQEVDLSFNNLKVMNLTELLLSVIEENQKINLTYNNISYISFDRNFGAGSVMYYQFYYRYNIFQKFENNLIQIDLSNNPLACDCNNFELIQYLNLRLSFPKPIRFHIEVGETKCFGTKQFENIPIKHINPKQITCKYDDKECPYGCICFTRPYDSILVIDCSFKNLTEPPFLTMKNQRIEVNLTGNLLEGGPSEYQGYDMVVNLYLSSNKLKTFDWSPPHIEQLYLDRNNLNNLSPRVLETFNNAVNFSKLTLDDNSWLCDCLIFDLQLFLRNHYNIIKNNSVLCHDDDKPLIDKTITMCNSSSVIAQTFIIILVFFFTTAATMALYFRYKKEIKILLYSKRMCLWFVTEEELDENKKYDIFLSFSHKDQEFVSKNLLYTLEKSFKLHIHSRDWIPGELINNQIVDSVYNSRRTLAVLSNNYLESAWGKLEFLMAHKQSIEERIPRVIVIKLGELNTDEMDDDFKAYIKTYTYIEWGEPWFWKKLFYALPHCTSFSSKYELHTFKHIDEEVPTL